MTGGGTITAGIPAGVAHDSSGNPNIAGTSSDNQVTYDIAAPTVTVNQAATQPDPTNASPIKFTVVFNEPVSDFGAGDVSFGGSSAPGTKSAVITDSGDHMTFNISVSGMTGSGDVYVSIDPYTVHDAAGNGNAASTSSDNLVLYDISAPTVTINQSNSQADPSKNSVISFTVAFSKAVIDFTGSNVTLSGSAGATSASVSGSGTNYTVSVSGMVRDGTVIASIPAGVVHDTVGNVNSASSSTDNQVLYDATAPSVTINQTSTQADPTNVSPIHFLVVFSEPVASFGSVTLSGTAGANETVITNNGDDKTFNVAVGGMGRSGTVIARILAGASYDLAGNFSTASTSSDNEVMYDISGPTVAINQAESQADPTSAETINFTVIFSKVVTDFTGSDVSLTGTAGATSAVVTGSGTTYNVAVSGMTGSGTVIASIAANAVHDALGNPGDASTSTDNLVDYIHSPEPLTVTINQASAQADPTRLSPINFTVIFNKSVNDFTAEDVTLSGTAGPSIASITGSGTTYTVTVSGMTAGTGTVIASLAAGVTHDASGSPNQASTSNDNSVDYDIVNPTATINQAAAQDDPTNVSPINFTVVFSEPVNDFSAEDITLKGTSGANTALISGSGKTFTVAVSGMSASGSVTAEIAAGSVHDAAGNGNNASASTDNTVTYDVTKPTVTINQASTQADPTNASIINFTILFSKPVSDFSAEDVNINSTAGAVTTTLTGSGTNYTLAVSGMNKSGIITATLNAGVAHDSLGNGNTASTSSDNQVTYDITAPTVTLNQASGQADPTGSAPINFTINFSEAVTGFDANDINLTSTAGTLTAVLSGSGTTYTVAVSGMNKSGNVTAAIAAGAANDAAGNANTASTSSDNVVTYDATGLSVSINQAASQTDPTKASVINFTVEFNKPVSDFTSADVTLNSTAGSVTAAVSGSDTTYNIAVSGMSKSGDVTASLAAGVAHDSVGNGNTASTSSDNKVTYDITAPSVTINQASGQADPTSASTINFTAVFSETVSGFTNSDVTVSGTAAGTKTVSVSSSDNKTYTLTVSGMTAGGTVIATIAAGAANDAAGNNNTASTSSDNTVTYTSTTKPTVTINQASGQSDPTGTTPIKFTVVFSETVTDFANGDVTLSGSAGANTSAITGSGTTYTVAVSGMNKSGTVIASIAANAAHNAAGTGNAASTSTDNSVTYNLANTNQAPVITEGDSTSVNMSEDASPTPFALTLHATDANSDSLTWNISSRPSHGTASVSSSAGTSREISYTPSDNYNGKDSFKVRVSDGKLSDTITVNVTISAVNDAPVILSGSSRSVSVSEDASSNSFFLFLIALDADNTTLTWSISSPAAHGTASVSGTGYFKSIKYAPASNYNGSDSFVVQVSDGNLSDTITINVTIRPVNDAPVCSNTTLTTSKNTTKDIAPVCTDVDGDTLTYSIVSQASKGKASILSNQLHYVPNNNATGSDTFTYRARDGSANSNTARVNVTINQ
ncbi:MAG: Ig-like domain-containing protein [Anaerolineae bacterium]|nr:Ig-like domain-containing protein [Anaerolineae bacterium]